MSSSHVGAAADEERQHQHGCRSVARAGRCHRRLVVEESRQDLSGHPPAPKRLGQRRWPRGSADARVSRVPRGRAPASRVGGLPAEQLGDPARHQRRQPAMGAHRRRLAEPHLGEPPVPGERLGQDHVAVVPGARHHRDDGDFVGRQLVEHRVESRLALVERDRHLMEQPAGAERLRRAGGRARWRRDRAGIRARRGPVRGRSPGHLERHQVDGRQLAAGDDGAAGAKRP